jgi:hypothetical protein
MDIIEILTVSDAAIVQRMLRRFLRIVVNRTHHYTPYRQYFRWRVPFPQTPQVKNYFPGNLIRGRRQHCPLSIPDKKKISIKMATLEVPRTRAAFTYPIGILFISSVNLFTSAAFLCVTAPGNHVGMYFRTRKTFTRLAPGNRSSAPMAMLFSAATMHGSWMLCTS